MIRIDLLNPQRLITVLFILFAIGVAGWSYYIFGNLQDEKRRPEREAFVLRLMQLDKQIAANAGDNQPAPSLGAAPMALDKAYTQGLALHQELLNETRSELKLAQEQLKEANEAIKEANAAEGRVKEGGAIFLAFFGVIAALVVGQGYLQVHGWKEQADLSLKQIEDVTPKISAIEAATKSLESELPRFLATARGQLLATEDPSGPVQQETIAVLDEIDHLTYLGTQVRFQPNRPEKEVPEYAASLLAAARAHIARRGYWEAKRRIDEFFNLFAQIPTLIKPEEAARAYSYRALASYQLIKTFMQERSWVKEANSERWSRLRKSAFADVSKAQDICKDWLHSYFVEALLCSFCYVPADVTDQTRREKLYVEGQRKSINLYRSLLTGVPRRSSPQNLACCLKRVADTTGDPQDYEAFKIEIQAFQTDEEIFESLVATGIADESRADYLFLWQNIMADAELFGKVDKLDGSGYKEFWISILDAKVVLRDWRSDLQEIRQTNPATNTWQIRL